jgi:hypothetical protein
MLFSTLSWRTARPDAWTRFTFHDATSNAGITSTDYNTSDNPPHCILQATQVLVTRTGYLHSLEQRFGIYIRSLSNPPVESFRLVLGPADISRGLPISSVMSGAL